MTTPPPLLSSGSVNYLWGDASGSSANAQSGPSSSTAAPVNQNPPTSSAAAQVNRPPAQFISHNDVHPESLAWLENPANLKSDKERKLANELLSYINADALELIAGSQQNNSCRYKKETRTRNGQIFHVAVEFSVCQDGLLLLKRAAVREHFSKATFSISPASSSDASVTQRGFGAIPVPHPRSSPNKVIDAAPGEQQQFTSSSSLSGNPPADSAAPESSSSTGIRTEATSSNVSSFSSMHLIKLMASRGATFGMDEFSALNVPKWRAHFSQDPEILTALDHYERRRDQVVPSMSMDRFPITRTERRPNANATGGRAKPLSKLSPAAASPLDLSIQLTNLLVQRGIGYAEIESYNVSDVTALRERFRQDSELLTVLTQYVAVRDELVRMPSENSLILTQIGTRPKQSTIRERAAGTPEKRIANTSHLNLSIQLTNLLTEQGISHAEIESYTVNDVAALQERFSQNSAILTTLNQYIAVRPELGRDASENSLLLPKIDIRPKKTSIGSRFIEYRPAEHQPGGSPPLSGSDGAATAPSPPFLNWLNSSPAVVSATSTHLGSARTDSNPIQLSIPSVVDLTGDDNMESESSADIQAEAPEISLAFNLSTNLIRQLAARGISYGQMAAYNLSAVAGLRERFNADSDFMNVLEAYLAQRHHLVKDTSDDSLLLTKIGTRPKPNTIGTRITRPKFSRPESSVSDPQSGRDGTTVAESVGPSRTKRPLLEERPGVRSTGPEKRLRSAFAATQDASREKVTGTSDALPAEPAGPAFTKADFDRNVQVAVALHKRGWTHTQVVDFKFSDAHMNLLRKTHEKDPILIEMLNDHFKARHRLGMIIGNGLFINHDDARKKNTTTFPKERVALLSNSIFMLWCKKSDDTPVMKAPAFPPDIAAAEKELIEIPRLEAWKKACVPVAQKLLEANLSEDDLKKLTWKNLRQIYQGDQIPYMDDAPYKLLINKARLRGWPDGSADLVFPYAFDGMTLTDYLRGIVLQ
jgi:hypothetical protein